MRFYGIKVVQGGYEGSYIAIKGNPTPATTDLDRAAIFIYKRDAEMARVQWERTAFLRGDLKVCRLSTLSPSKK